jgi:tetratricopeptide (TPR) repeat protein
MADDRRQRLVQQRSLLSASLDDAEREHLAGELDEEAFSLIAERDRTRLEAVDAELAQLGDEPATEPTSATQAPPTSPPGWLRRNRLVVGLAVVVVALAAVVAVLASDRSTPTSSSAQAAQIATMLDTADAQVAQGKIAEAIATYDGVLAIEPNQAHALAEAGWLTFEAGNAADSTSLLERGESQVRSAIVADPTLAAARLYLGVILLTAHKDPSAALSEFKAFLALKPSTALVDSAQPYIDKAASEAGVSPPTTSP